MVATLVVCAVGLRAQDLTLDQAVTLALAHNRGLLNARIEPLKLDEERAALRARRLPAMNLYVLGSQMLNPIDFTLSAGLLGVYPAAGPIPGADIKIRTGYAFTGFYTVKVVQPLSSLYRIKLNVRLLDVSKQIAEEQRRIQEQEIVRNVKKLYYALEQTQSSLNMMRETVALYRELKRLTDEYFSRQAVLKSDQLNVQLNLAKAEQSGLLLHGQEDNAKEQLNLLLGREVHTEFSVRPLSEATDLETDAETARKQALANRPEVKAAHLRAELAQKDILAKRAEYIPEVNAEFNSLGLANFNRFLPVDVNTVGVSLSWDIFDWGRKKHELAERKYAAAEASNLAAEADSSVVVEVDEKLRQVQASRNHVKVSRLAREVAEENVRVVKDRFSVEAVLVKDVLQAQAALEQANAEEAQATVEFWSAKADYERALGASQ